MLLRLALSSSLALGFAGAINANPIGKVLLFCDGCDNADMQSRAIEQGPGVRYVANLRDNRLLGFRVSRSAPSPGIASTAAGGDRGAAARSVKASSPLRAEPFDVEPAMQAAFRDLLIAKAVLSDASPAETFALDLALLTAEAGEALDPLMYGVYCDGGPQGRKWPSALSSVLRSASAPEGSAFYVPARLNAAMMSLDAQGFGRVAGESRALLWNDNAPAYVARFCDATSRACATFDVTPDLRQTRWTFRDASAAGGDLPPYPSLCTDRNTWGYVFESERQAREFGAGLERIGISFSYARRGTVFDASCARVRAAPFLDCARTPAKR